MLTDIMNLAIGTESVSITVHHEVHQGPQQVPQGERQEQEQPQPQQKIETATITQETTPLPTHTTTSAIENEALGAGSPPADSEEVPHARGPPVVGVQDLGLQDGKGVEMPLSNADGSGDASSAPPGSNNSSNNDTTQEKDDENRNQDPASTSSEGKKDVDGDISLDDAKGNNENESATGSAEEAQKSESEPAK